MVLKLIKFIFIFTNIFYAEWWPHSSEKISFSKVQLFSECVAFVVAICFLFGFIENDGTVL